MAKTTENGTKPSSPHAGLRRWAAGLNTCASLVLFFLLLAMLNYLSARHYVRADWSRAKLYRLSDKTLGLLESLTNTVRVLVFLQAGHEMYQDVELLLREYEAASRRLRIEWVDPDRDLARAEELLREMEIARPNVVVFECDGRRKVVSPDDMVEYDYAGLRFGRPPQRVAFRGEQAFTSAILDVTQAKRPVVYFLQGHGEGDLNDYDPRAGYSELKRELQQDNIEVRPLLLSETRGVPQDADAVVLLGPRRRLARREWELLTSYLESNGRLMVLAEAMTDTGLEDFLTPWGIRLGRDIVVDATRTLTGRELFLTEFEPHPITERLKGITSIFYVPRSVEAAEPAGAEAESADKPRVTVLARCSRHGWAETDLSDGRMTFDADRDLPGPVGVAAAVEKGSVPGIEMRLRPTRLVVLGDATFVSNAGLTGGDLDFFMGALNWLLEREPLIAISPKPIEEWRLVLSERELWGLFWVLVVGLPAGVAAAGVLVSWRRRK